MQGAGREQTSQPPSLPRQSSFQPCSSRAPQVSPPGPASPSCALLSFPCFPSFPCLPSFPCFPSFPCLPSFPCGPCCCCGSFSQNREQWVGPWRPRWQQWWLPIKRGQRVGDRKGRQQASHKKRRRQRQLTGQDGDLQIQLAACLDTCVAYACFAASRARSANTGLESPATQTLQTTHIE